MKVDKASVERIAKGWDPYLSLRGVYMHPYGDKGEAYFSGAFYNHDIQKYFSKYYTVKEISKSEFIQKFDKAVSALKSNI